MKSLEKAWHNAEEKQEIKDAIKEHNASITVPGELFNFTRDTMRDKYEPLLNNMGYEYNRQDLIDILLY